MKQIIHGTLCFGGMLLLGLETAGALMKSRWVLFLLGFAVLVLALHLASEWSWHEGKEKAPCGSRVPTERTEKRSLTQ